MRSPSAAIFLLALLLLVTNFGNARKDPAANYWKRVMKGEPMPKAIEEVLVHDHGAEISESKEKKRWDPSQINMAHFMRDFDTSPNVIIYHSHNNMGRQTTPEKSPAKIIQAAGGEEISE
ncbi:hypothetical protein Vadar_019466 [Vaccinium darrowii]|uniref:Uncharacterized protein n=1 Tax=Vaccinium darrowii TaxID=229202 RepID=A0ACB7YEI4_9ERIC|nr:hypothetical protein Vadar_019466 [Vaccinium darrowii]